MQIVNGLFKNSPKPAPGARPHHVVDKVGRLVDVLFARLCDCAPASSGPAKNKNKILKRNKRIVYFWSEIILFSKQQCEMTHKALIRTSKMTTGHTTSRVR